VADSSPRHARAKAEEAERVSEDDVKHAEKDLQKAARDFIHQIDDLIKGERSRDHGSVSA